MGGMTRVRRGAVMALTLTALLATSGVVPVAAGDRGSALVSLREPRAPALLDDGDPQSLRQAIRESLAWLSRQPSGQGTALGPRVVTVADQTRTLRRMLELLADDPSPAALQARVSAEFDLLRSPGADGGSMLVTGYHEPIIDVSDVPSGEYRVPILGVP